MLDIFDFCDKLEGYYDSWDQACRDPARYAHVKIKWTRLEKLAFESKQWYHYLGEEKPYRKRWHRVKEDKENNCIRVENWAPNWENHNSCCDMLFYLVDGLYTGKVATNDCIVNGGTVKSMVEFNGKTYRSMDQGWSNKKRVWGSEVIYEFKKVGL